MWKILIALSIKLHGIPSGFTVVFEKSYCGLNKLNLGTWQIRSGLLKVIAANKRITALDDDTFRGANRLEAIDLQVNFIADISIGAFAGLSTVRQLNLGGNQITILEVGVFDPFTNLWEINLSGNLITVLDDGLFIKNHFLKYIYLENNEIFALGPSFVEAKC